MPLPFPLEGSLNETNLKEGLLRAVYLHKDNMNTWLNH